MKKKQPTWGGARENAGRPKGEPTVVITFRVKEKYADKIRAAVKLLISKIQREK